MLLNRSGAASTVDVDEEKAARANSVARRNEGAADITTGDLK